MNIFRAALTLSCALILAACSEGGAKKKTEPPPVPVTTAKASAKDIPVSLRIVGRAEAYESVSMRSRIDGQVLTVLFTEGQAVRQGDVLIRLDPTDFSARLQQPEATVARDEALVAKTRADTARYVELRSRNFVSEEKVNDIRTNEAAALANLRASKASAEVARLQLSYTTIRAPINGTIGSRLVFPGSAVKTNDTVLAVVNRTRPLLVSFSVPEKHLSAVRAQTRAKADKSGTMRALIGIPGDATQHFEGEVFFMDNAVDAATGTILMKARVPNESDKLTPGQFLNITLLLETLNQAVSIPNDAVQQGLDGNFTYVVKEDGKVEVRKIVVAASDSGFSAIRSGLQIGETVVTDGQLRLSPGTRIKEAGPENQAGKPASAKETSSR